MSSPWSLMPVFLLASVLLALARRPGSPSPLACTAFAGVFFVMGVLGLMAEASWAAALGTSVLCMLVGLPLASVAVALWRRPANRAENTFGYV